MIAMAVRRSRRTISGMREGRAAYGYLRVSTDEKRQMSIPDQKALIEAIARKEGYTITRWFKDTKRRGVKREGLHSMLEAIETDPECGAILFWQTSRLWGHVEQQRRIMYRSRINGVRLIDSKGKEWKDDTPMEILMNLISSGVSEYETNTVAERVRDTHSKKLEAGTIITRPVTGVITEPYIEKDGDGRDVIRSRFVVDKDLMDVVRGILRDYAAGDPPWRIAERLAVRGVKTQGEGSWTSGNIRRIIDNEFYIGKMIWNRTRTDWEIDEITGDKIKRVNDNPETQWVYGKSPLGVILAEDPSDPDSVAEAQHLFEECQKQRRFRGMERPPKDRDDRVFEGMVRCLRCNYSMQPRRFGHKLATGERNPNWDFRCQHRTNMNKGCTKSHTMTENQIFMRVYRAINGSGIEGERIVLEQGDGERRRAVAALSFAASEVKEAKEAVARVHLAWESGSRGPYKTVEQFVERLEATESLLAEREEAYAKSEANLAALESGAPRPVPEEIRDVLSRCVDRLRDESIPIEARRLVAMQAFKEIRIDNPRVEVVPRLEDLKVVEQLLAGR